MKQIKSICKNSPFVILLAVFRKQIGIISEYVFMAFLMFVPLFAECIWTTSPGFIGSSVRQVTAVCRDMETQWMLVLCLACYSTMLLALKRKTEFIISPPHRIHRHPSNHSDALSPSDEKGAHKIHWKCLAYFLKRILNADVWLAIFIFLVLLQYALTYTTELHSIQIPTLMASIVFGNAIATWVRWQSNEIKRCLTCLMYSLLGLLATSALCRSEATIRFQYHGALRWTGVWDNPNVYGLLMGVGFILSFGLIVVNFRRRNWFLISIFFSAGLCSFGLLKSYSRGAWLAVFVGLIYLTVQAAKSSQYSARVCRNWIPITLLGGALLVLMFYQVRYYEARPAQRIGSMTNPNDFSWRNRVAAWEGAGRMMVDRPLTGFGWGQAEGIYGKKYCPPRVNEPAAVEMNDYLMIGISSGVPAMICFLTYIGMALTRKAERGEGGTRKPEMTGVDCLTATCRAGAIVLLVGFWFDGGLFKLPVAVVFWMLLELSRVNPGRASHNVSISSSSATVPVEALAKKSPCSSWWRFGRRDSAALPGRPLIRSEIVLRWVAAMLAVWVMTETALYLVTPYFVVSERTLFIARKILVQPKEKMDFEFLAAQPIWQGQKLKTLLEHVELAGYNRELINWQLDDTMYRDFVLSPVIKPATGNQQPATRLDWRRPLWEEFYPRIRHESSPVDAAQIVIRHLRERVTIATLSGLPHDVPEIWLRQITDAAGFQIIYVAALRSVGVPARLNVNANAEYWNGTHWQSAPAPAVLHW